MKTLEEVTRRSSARCPRPALPLALLPVQVQTRYVTRDGEPQLLVRVYPDELHLDAHEPAPDRGRGAVGQEGTGSSIWPAARDRDGRAARLGRSSRSASARGARRGSRAG